MKGIFENKNYINRPRGWDSSVGTVTHYRLDGPWIKSRWGARFSTPVQTDPGVHPASYTMGTGSFPGVKQPGCGIDHPPPSTAEVKERVRRYLYSHTGSLWPVLGWTLPLLVLLTDLRNYLPGLPECKTKLLIRCHLEFAYRAMNWTVLSWITLCTAKPWHMVLNCHKCSQKRKQSILYHY
jgi:hypothetical protein